MIRFPDFYFIISFVPYLLKEAVTNSWLFILSDANFILQNWLCLYQQVKHLWMYTGKKGATLLIQKKGYAFSVNAIDYFNTMNSGSLELYKILQASYCCKNKPATTDWYHKRQA